jgi:hypothetical protein
MAVSKRGMRKLSVDGVDYLWKLKRDEDHLDENLNVIVVPESGGAILTIDLGAARPNRATSIVALPDGSSYTKTVPHAVATPGRVTDAIRKARAAGWLPEQGGGPFTVLLEQD